VILPAVCGRNRTRAIKSAWRISWLLETDRTDQTGTGAEPHIACDVAATRAGGVLATLPAGRRLSGEQVDELVAAYGQGSTGRELAERHGLARSTVIALLRERGIAVRHPRGQCGRRRAGGGLLPSRDAADRHRRAVGTEQERGVAPVTAGGCRVNPDVRDVAG
jgi:hypothetical protein